MNGQAREGVAALTEREKQTLRLIVRGHDAKSIARTLDRSVHTVNERLRDARRKLAVSSSREAARLLLEAEGGQPSPDFRVADTLGADAARIGADPGGAPIVGAGRAPRSFRIIIGGLVMSLALALVALAATQPTSSVSSSAAASKPSDAAIVDAARAFLVLVDQGRWEDSYRATGSSFRRLNTAEVWAEVSRQVRVPLGGVVSRTFIGQENLPAPPSGYEVVKFRTRYANKAEAIETVSLDREDGVWRVVGVTIS